MHNTCIEDTVTPNERDRRISIRKELYEDIYRCVKSGESQSRIAAEYKISQQRVSQIVQLVSQRERKPESVSTPDFPQKLYRCIVIDPPWPVEKIEREQRPLQGKNLDYPTMTIEEIRKLPVSELADKSGCHIYLWVTQKYLPEGLRLFEYWGIKYQCILTWVKPTGITPFSWMYNTEHVLFGRIGNLPLCKVGIKLSFNAEVRRHSEKPDVFYEIVCMASPPPRLDMFARGKREGFDVWGAEVQKEVYA
jgi:N6-adenosine-specific RNA methylase IME4/predicted XRE-type DNA-binding protein